MNVGASSNTLGRRVGEGVAQLDRELGITDAPLVVSSVVEEVADWAVPCLGVVGPRAHNGVQVGTRVAVKVDKVLASSRIAAPVSIAATLSPDVIRAAVGGRIAVTTAVVPKYT